MAERLTQLSIRHNVSLSSLAETIVSYALEQLSETQLREQLDLRGASMRRPRRS